MPRAWRCPLASKPGRREKSMRLRSSSLSGALFSKKRGRSRFCESSQPRENSDSHRALEPSMLSTSDSYTCSTEKPLHTSTSSATAWSGSSAPQASAAALMAPADVPHTTLNKPLRGTPARRRMATISQSTPT